MKQLNARAGKAALEMGAHAATDITGLGFIGHAQEMVQASGVGMRIHFRDIPFMEGARFYAEKGIFPGGAYDNFQYYRDYVRFNTDLSELKKLLLFDPKTSGGLLLAVDEGIYEDFISHQITSRLFWKIGEIIQEKQIIIT